MSLYEKQKKFMGISMIIQKLNTLTQKQKS